MSEKYSYASVRAMSLIDHCNPGSARRSSTRCARMRGAGLPTISAVWRSSSSSATVGVTSATIGSAAAMQTAIGSVGAGAVAVTSTASVAPSNSSKCTGRRSARSLFKHILIGVPPEKSDAIAVYRKFGFRKIGEFVAYQKPER